MSLPWSAKSSFCKTLVTLLLYLSFLFSPSSAYSATFNITSNDSSGLIDAINESNSNSGPDTINLTSNGEYLLTTVNNNSYSNSGLPLITSNITINGYGSTISRNSTENFRIFSVVSPGQLSINKITINNGYDADTIDDYGGGAFFNLGGTLTIDDSIISNNRANVGGGGGIWQGGNSLVTITNTKIAYNRLGKDGSGGGLLKRGPGLTEIQTSEITENYAYTNGGAIYAGNDLFTGVGGGLIDVERTKISNNSAGDFGGAIFNYSGQVNITNSCINENSPYAVFNWSTSAFIISAVNNWWGHESGPSGLGGGLGDYISERVNFVPFLNLCPPFASPSPSLSPSPSPSPSLSPSPSPTPNPVVLLPGMGGSWNTGDLITGNNIGIWKKTPFIKVYDNLKNTFLYAGYIENDDYFEFYYDWRKRLDNLADDLNNYLEAVLNDQPAGTKVDLVGHSLGGLVARTYAQKYGTAKVDDLVTTGSPHEGSVPAYLAWAGAETDETWETLGLEFYLHRYQGRFTSPVTAIQNLAPSLKDLLPIFDFAKTSNGSVIPASSMQTVNDYLLTLKTNLNNGLTQLMATIAGNEKETVEWVKLGDRTLTDRLLDRWPDGRPIAYENTQNGDSTVLSKSALIENTNQQTVASSHVDLVQTSAGIDAIMNALNIDAIAQTGNTQPDKNPSLFFLLHSPAELTVTAPDGGQAGFGVDNPMDNSFYSPEDKLLLIYNALAGEYQTAVTGTDDGSYQLDIGQLTDNGDYWSSLVDEIQTDATDIWTVNFDSQNPLADPVVDETGQSKIDQAKLRLEQLKAHTTPKLTVYLNKISKLLDKNKLPSLRLALTSIYKFRHWVDKFSQSDAYLKFEADQIGQLLNQALVISGQNSQSNLPKKQVWAELRTAEWAKERLENKAEKINGDNLLLGNTLDLMNRYFERAQENFDQGNYWQTHADALVVRVLAIEANALIK